MPRIAACNVTFREVADFPQFAEHIRAVLDSAAGADLVVLPELVTFELMTASPSWPEADGLEAVMETSDFAEQFRELMAAEAAARGQYLLAGSHLVRSGGGYLNVSQLLGPNGGVLAEHAKTHLFSLEHTLGIVEGDQLEVVELPFARVGITICYEAEVPECATSLAEQGAQVLLCPSLTLSEAGFWRVRHCLAARAVENQVYAVHAAAGGPARKAWPGSWARSAVLSPCDEGWPADGVLAETAPNVDAVALAEVDLGQLAENRRSGAATTFADRRRRAELYRSWPTHIPS